ncbi:uncharacterized protein LOC126316983 isoform X2 [Schistocerca gregaria]|nr:uncharacterized protein LOC126316983 isoform X2 [Schistocerca gregaria]
MIPVTDPFFLRSTDSALHSTPIVQRYSVNLYGTDIRSAEIHRGAPLSDPWVSREKHGEPPNVSEVSTSITRCNFDQHSVDAERRDQNLEVAVFDIPGYVTVDLLNSEFSKVGRVASCNLYEHPETKVHIGVGSVRYHCSEHALNAVKCLNGKVVHLSKTKKWVIRTDLDQTGVLRSEAKNRVMEKEFLFYRPFSKESLSMIGECSLNHGGSEGNLENSVGSIEGERRSEQRDRDMLSKEGEVEGDSDKMYPVLRCRGIEELRDEAQSILEHCFESYNCLCAYREHEEWCVVFGCESDKDFALHMMNHLAITPGVRIYLESAYQVVSKNVISEGIKRVSCIGLPREGRVSESNREVFLNGWKSALLVEQQKMIAVILLKELRDAVSSSLSSMIVNRTVSNYVRRLFESKEERGLKIEGVLSTENEKEECVVELGEAKRGEWPELSGCLAPERTDIVRAMERPKKVKLAAVVRDPERKENLTGSTGMISMGRDAGNMDEVYEREAARLFELEKEEEIYVEHQTQFSPLDISKRDAENYALFSPAVQSSLRVAKRAIGSWTPAQYYQDYGYLDLSPVQKQAVEQGYDLRFTVSGSARTDPVRSLDETERSRIRVHYVHQQGIQESPDQGMNASATPSGTARARQNRQEKRLNLSTAFNPLFRDSRLENRRKRLRFGKSTIHEWGLFALEFIPAGEMVIEYLGEIIRLRVADKREKKYKEQGMGSSYMFRIVDDWVIDATQKGNFARFLNHSCNPNCISRIIPGSSRRHIAIYSKRDIQVGEEVTYDYKFPIEPEKFKIKCLCGSSKCRGTLN